MRNDGKTGMSDEEVGPLTFYKFTVLELTCLQYFLLFRSHYSHISP
jgi:hypothetical protein